MLPVYDKPTIQYVVEEAIASGIDDIIIITGRNKRSIEDHFDKSYELEYTLQKAGKDRELKEIRKITDWQTYVISDKRTKTAWALQSSAVKDILEKNPSPFF